MSLLDEIEPLKAEALAELNAATDQASLDQAKGKWLGPQGHFTGLMKQLGALPKGDRPTAGKVINIAKGELETALKAARDRIVLTGVVPTESTDFTAPGRRCSLGKLHPLLQSGTPGRRRRVGLRHPH